MSSCLALVTGYKIMLFSFCTFSLSYKRCLISASYLLHNRRTLSHGKHHTQLVNQSTARKTLPHLKIDASILLHSANGLVQEVNVFDQEHEEGNRDFRLFAPELERTFLHRGGADRSRGRRGGRQTVRRPLLVALDAGIALVGGRRRDRRDRVLGDDGEAVVVVFGGLRVARSRRRYRSSRRA